MSSISYCHYEEFVDCIISILSIKIYLEHKCPLEQFGHNLWQQRKSSGSNLLH